VRCLVGHAGARLWLSLTLLVLIGLLEGSGLLLLPSLLKLLGLGEVSGAGGIGQAAASVLRSGRIPFTLAAVPALLVAVMGGWQALLSSRAQRFPVRRSLEGEGGSLRWANERGLKHRATCRCIVANWLATKEHRPSPRLWPGRQGTQRKSLVISVISCG
jgi:hypothetical protein